MSVVSLRVSVGKNATSQNIGIGPCQKVEDLTMLRIIEKTEAYHKRVRKVLVLFPSTSAQEKQIRHRNHLQYVLCHSWCC